MESHANTELGARSRAFQSMFEQGALGEHTHIGDTRANPSGDVERWEIHLW